MQTVNFQVISLASHVVLDSPEEYCHSEIFQPRCLKNEVILMRSAAYGRMRVGRCITSKEMDAIGPRFGQDPAYLGCSANILPLLDEKCSGKTDCDVRVVEISEESINPCFPGLRFHLEASYECISSKSLLNFEVQASLRFYISCNNFKFCCIAYFEGSVF